MSGDSFPKVESSFLTGLMRLAKDWLSSARRGEDETERSARERIHALASEGRDERYTLDKEIARGGMGVIYRVEDTALRRTLAMKVVAPRDDADARRELDPVILARFLEEARVTGQLDHPGVVPLHDLGIDSTGQVYFTMKLVRGLHLGDVFALAKRREDGWSLERVVEALVKVCETMAYAHSKGVVHRDLKPQNIMAGRFGEVYVMDWGVAKVLERVETAPARRATDSLLGTRDVDSRALITLDGSVFGTPAYISPEQARGQNDKVLACSDIYSVGAILYHLLAGHPPYLPEGTQASVHTLLKWVIEEPPAPLRREARDAPRDLVAICEKAMARDPEGRYPDMRALGEDLRAWLVGRTVSARRLSALGRAGRWCTRNPWLTALLLAITLGGATGLWRLAALGSDLVKSAAIDEAAAKAHMLETVNDLYAEAVVARVDRAHVDVTHDWQDKAGAIPLPATFLTVLAGRITDQASGVVVKHYSDLPFRFRGPANLDEFGRRAMSELRADPTHPVESFEQLDGRPVLRYATARVMRHSCVNCHNSHPDTPKADWKVGDVRGVLEIIRPLDAGVQRSRAGLGATLAVVAALVIGLTVVCAFALVRGARGERRR